MKYPVDQSELRTSKAFHIDGTEMQSKCEKWKIERKFRITASVFQEFSKTTLLTIRKFWNKVAVPSTSAIKWGNQKEAEAVKSIETRLKGFSPNRGKRLEGLGHFKAWGHWKLGV